MCNKIYMYWFNLSADSLLFNSEYTLLDFLHISQTREKKPRESLLRAEFAKAIHYINKELPDDKRLKFLHMDLSKLSRR